jgi:hypothetical protein
MIITIALPSGMTDPNVNPDTAPTWLDVDGTPYLVASGLLEGDYATSDPITAQPDRLNVVVGMDGLEALSAMGLSPYSPPEE